VRGTILRIVDLRSEPAYIRVAGCRPARSRRMVEFSFVPHRSTRGDVAAVFPTAIQRYALLMLGPRRLPETIEGGDPLVRRAQIEPGLTHLTCRSTSGICGLTYQQARSDQRLSDLTCNYSYTILYH
jgi:hypothetical protein